MKNPEGSNESHAIVCFQGKLVIKLSIVKIRIRPPEFLECITCDICGSIYPPCRPFRYFMILISA